MTTLHLTLAEMNLAGIPAEDRKIREFFQCNCLISEYERVINGKVAKKWFSDGGCRPIEVEVSKAQALTILSARIAKASETIKWFEEKKAAGRRFGNRESYPLWDAESVVKRSAKTLAEL